MTDTIIQRLHDESDLCANEGAAEIVMPLDDAIREIERLTRALSEGTRVCEWSDAYGEPGEPSGVYQTGCGKEFNVGENSDEPTRWMKFCCYCGGATTFPAPDPPEAK